MIARRRSRMSVPDGWPSPAEVAQRVGRELADGGCGEGWVATASSVCATRRWSVVYTATFRRNGRRRTLIIKCVREPHHTGPGQGSTDGGRSECEAISLRLAFEAGIPVARPVAHITALDAVVMERVRGRRINSFLIPPARRIDALRQIGEHSRRFAEIDPPFEPTLERSARAVLSELADLGRELAEATNHDVFDAIWPEIMQSLGSELSDEEQLSWVHGDLNPGNVWVSAGSGLHIMDIVFSTKAHPVADVAQLAAGLRSSKLMILTGGADRLRGATSRRVEALREGFGPHDSYAFHLYELSALAHHWSELHERFPSPGAVGPQRLMVHRIDSFFAREIRRWLYRFREDVVGINGSQA